MARVHALRKFSYHGRSALVQCATVSTNLPQRTRTDKLSRHLEMGSRQGFKPAAKNVTVGNLLNKYHIII